jgi:hypothetical protein
MYPHNNYQSSDFLEVSFLTFLSPMLFHNNLIHNSSTLLSPSRFGAMSYSVGYCTSVIEEWKLELCLEIPKENYKTTKY